MQIYRAQKLTLVVAVLFSSYIVEGDHSVSIGILINFC